MDLDHFAQIDTSNNIVQRVLVITQDVINTGAFGDPNTFVQTSYGARDGIEWDMSTNTPTGNTALRYRYAAIGMWYDQANDVFSLPKPASNPSWVYTSNSWSWQPPIPMPTDAVPPNYYEWIEANTSWVLVTVTE
jgi:hypothetical protein